MVVHLVVVGADLRIDPLRGTRPTVGRRPRPPRPCGVVRFEERDLRRLPHHDRTRRHARLTRDGGLREGSEVVLRRRAARVHDHDPDPALHQPWRLRLVGEPLWQLAVPREECLQDEHRRRGDVVHLRPRAAWGKHGARADDDVLPAVAELGLHALRGDPGC